MKKLLFALSAAVISVVLTISANAMYTAAMLSPALAVISEEYTMVKSGLVSGDIVFSQGDFKKAVGADFDSVTITSLPLPGDGKLTYNGTEVVLNQTLSSSSLSCLRFTPASGSHEGSFRFKAMGEYSTECILRYTDTVNLAPTAANASDDVAVWTQKDITVFGKLAGFDPDGDAITFEITKLPAKGVVILNDKEGGGYTYTPCDGVTGSDTFSYVVRDEWGNYSEESTVIVTVDKCGCDLVFADMDGHWAHNAALVMAENKAMDFEYTDSGIFFDPDSNITREEFLVCVMKILGAGEIEPCATVFADDAEITEEASGYVQRAYSLGIINGREKDGKLFFEPTATINRAEAAVILNSIIGESEPEVYPVFADADSVPAYARGSLYALSTVGIFRGNGDGNIAANKPLNRAETAQICLSVKKIYG